MCFPLELIKEVLIWLIVIAAIFALLQLLVRFLGPRLSVAADVLAFIVGVLRILIWAAVGIMAVTFVFGLIGCLLPGLPRLR